jgi:cell division protease FtsH
MQRRAQGQMGSVMQIGRSKAKTYSTEKPGTTFADIAGYEGVKQEVTEVIDFLKNPTRFAAIGARSRRACCSSARPGPARR